MIFLGTYHFPQFTKEGNEDQRCYTRRYTVLGPSATEKTSNPSLLDSNGQATFFSPKPILYKSIFFKLINYLLSFLLTTPSLNQAARSLSYLFKLFCSCNYG